MRRLYTTLVFVALAFPLGILATTREFAPAVIVGTFTVGAPLLVRLPLALMFVPNGWLKLWQAVGVGATAGLLSTGPFILGEGPAQAVRFVAPFCAIGAVHGLAFWLLAIFRNRELQSQVTEASQ